MSQQIFALLAARFGHAKIREGGSSYLDCACGWTCPSVRHADEQDDEWAAHCIEASFRLGGA